MINGSELVKKFFNKERSDKLTEKFNKKLSKKLVKIEKQIKIAALQGYDGIKINNPVKVGDWKLSDALIDALRNANYIVEQRLYTHTLEISWEHIKTNG